MTTDTQASSLEAKNEWFVLLEEAFTSLKEKVCKALDWCLDKMCPTSLRDFNAKYPNLGALKDDMLSVIKFIAVRALLVVVVVPAILICTSTYLFKKVKGMFKKKDSTPTK